MAGVQFDKAIRGGNGGIRFIKLEIGIGGIELGLFGVATKGIFGLQRFQVLDSGFVVAGIERILGLVVELGRTPLADVLERDITGASRGKAQPAVASKAPSNRLGSSERRRVEKGVFSNIRYTISESENAGEGLSALL